MRNVSLIVTALVLCAVAACDQFVTRDHRWQLRGEWNFALQNRLPELNAEFNGIDFGHAHIAETLLRTLDDDEVERARLEVLEFIFSKPAVPPDEHLVAPRTSRLVWDLQKAFDWAHVLHRSLYDLFASDVEDKETAYLAIMADYLSMPEAITSLPLDHDRLWSFPESRAFHERFPKFNSQIWAYHWLQAAVYDVQLMGDAAEQRRLMQPIIEHYHGYLIEPPVEWRFMPMMHEGAPEFSRRFYEAANVFDNLHMLHDNVDDVLSRPDLFPTLADKRRRILELLERYLHRNHVREPDRYAEFRAEHDERGRPLHAHHPPGPRAPSAAEVLGIAPPDEEVEHEPHDPHMHEHHHH